MLSEDVNIPLKKCYGEIEVKYNLKLICTNGNKIKISLNIKQLVTKMYGFFPLLLRSFSHLLNLFPYAVTIAF